jgi:hypothetical protein
MLASLHPDASQMVMPFNQLGLQYFYDTGYECYIMVYGYVIKSYYCYQPIIIFIGKCIIYKSTWILPLFNLSVMTPNVSTG